MSHRRVAMGRLAASNVRVGREAYFISRRCLYGKAIESSAFIACGVLMLEDDWLPCWGPKRLWL